MLDQARDLAEAGEAFSCYMMAMFGLDPEQRGAAAATGGKRRYRSSFLRLIEGWGFDSNGPEGAVLKGWVESRFGVCPSFHKEIIEQVSSRAWAAYVEEKMSSRFHNNAIWVQLDLLFEFCQWAIRRFAFPGETHLTLYRGVNAFDEHWIVERTAKREAVIRLNNLVSFSSDRGVAGCFGDTILTARVPVSKILFFNGLLSSHPLKGEGEYLAIGGEFRVSVGILRAPRMTGPAWRTARSRAYLGFAIGDALGATVEFMTKSEIAAQYGVHREIAGGGWLQAQARASDRRHRDGAGARPLASSGAAGSTRATSARSSRRG